MKHLLFTLLLALPFTAGADTYNYLNITSTSTVQSVALKQVKRITFEGTNLVVTATDGTTTTTPLATLTKLTFSDIGVAVRDLEGTSNKLTMEGGRIVAGGNGQLLLFNSSGQLVRQQYIGGAGDRVSLDGLPRGIYIARLGRQAIKILH